MDKQRKQKEEEERRKRGEGEREGAVRRIAERNKQAEGVTVSMISDALDLLDHEDDNDGDHE
eukprot:CAMPEP_0197539922 /NCGR_PEP_ID=MMETSP1318-20131121/64215_1 /TAXON_ID=552666 /ORGANISM="Partenskyella glossopodia, Strain RCC365" /LENGTH=61 /DNA_ID=CAMNT_0043098767 /DNA_START=1 /DNA_END=183 /DNA_ORIENTATION=+